jgi:hypothetical protein
MAKVIRNIELCGKVEPVRKREHLCPAPREALDNWYPARTYFPIPSGNRSLSAGSPATFFPAALNWTFAKAEHPYSILYRDEVPNQLESSRCLGLLRWALRAVQLDESLLPFIVEYVARTHSPLPFWEDAH